MGLQPDGSVDLSTACRMARASDVTYYADLPGGSPSCPNYSDVGYVQPPEAFFADVINAAVIGATHDAVILAFRGTLTIDTANWHAFWDSVLDWLDDADTKHISVPYAAGLVHQGFADSLETLWGQLVPSLRRLTAGGLPVFVTGHSKGGALATLASLRLLHEERMTPAGIFTFGAPRAGDTQFANAYNSAISAHWRFENSNDIVPHLPPKAVLLEYLGHLEPRLAGLAARDYQHVGVLEFLNWAGGITEGASIELDAERMAHLFDLLATGQVERVAHDHSIENEYIPKVCGSSTPAP